MNEKISIAIKNNDRERYLKFRYPEIADYEELIFVGENFSGVDWRKFPSSMNVFIDCVLDDVVLPPGQPIRIENCSARNLNICDITAIINAKNTDFTGLRYDDNTVLANCNDKSDVPSTFDKCMFDIEAREHFAKQGVVFTD